MLERMVKCSASSISISKSSYPASVSNAGSNAANSSGDFISGDGAAGVSGSVAPASWSSAPSATGSGIPAKMGSVRVTSVIEPLAPGSWTISRSSPNIWMIGSSVPNLLTRRVMLSNTPCIWSTDGSPMVSALKREISPWASARASFKPVRLGSLSARMSVRIWNRFGPIGNTCRFSRAELPSPKVKLCSVATTSPKETSPAKVTSNLVPVSAW